MEENADETLKQSAIKLKQDYNLQLLVCTYCQQQNSCLFLGPKLLETLSAIVPFGCCVWKDRINR